jgi:DNA-binding CsgD family transcriptional regulator
MAQVNQLSDREREVVKLLLQGKSNKLIALSLGISDRTVEFHLKNIYAKFQVSSRIELILILGNFTGNMLAEKLGYSTVDRLGKNTENRDRLNSQMDWATFFRDTVFIIGKELEMKNLLNTKHVLVGITSALFAGFLWVAWLIYFGSMSLNEIKAWVVPLIVILAMIGLSVGLIGKRNNNTLQKVFFSALFGTALSPFLVIPLMIIVVLPLGKLAAQFGLIDPSTMSSDVATVLATTAMIAIWLVAGLTIGTTLLFVTIKKPERMDNQKHTAENGLY